MCWISTGAYDNGNERLTATTDGTECDDDDDDDFCCLRQLSA